MSLFIDRTAVIATMHRKEEAIAPLLTQHLGVCPIVPPFFNTDQFGTFTRDVKRAGDQMEAARAKAEAVLTLTGEQLAVASEGSFGPHPLFPALPCDRELVLLLDQKLGLEVVGQVLSTATNFSHARVQTPDEARRFAQKVGFPAHGLVVMVHANPQNPEHIFKGITTEETLEQALDLAFSYSPDGQVHVETDMRALYNPSRMKVIAAATEDLIAKLNHCCPQCDWPGFELIERKAGLRCELCSMPTPLTRSTVYRCRKCEYQEEIPFPDGVETADPSQCQYCNP
ncbi:MAG: DUF6671 family protein [Leptolyngbyaceae cyanobacterium bins.59]|nr:DUF6671 family protein [Leptolyngbyaceae cyanobacterium bins.59]